MTLNDIFKTMKTGVVNSNLSYNDRFVLSKRSVNEPPEVEGIPLKTSDNQIIYTANGQPITTIE